MSSLAQTLVVPSLKNILFTTDFSPCSDAALPYLRDIAEHYGSTIHIVHVIPPEPSIELPLETLPELDADRDVARNSIKEMLFRKPFGKAPCTVTVRRGHFWTVVSAVIKEKRADLIVLGTHGRRGVSKMLLGSVAEQVFRSAECPVLTVGPHAVKQGNEPLRHAEILLATDFSIGSRHALSYAVAMARMYHSHLIILHVVPDGEEIAPTDFNVGAATTEVTRTLMIEEMRRARREMKEFVETGMLYELQPETAIEYGHAADAILRVAERKHADLIVMGAHRASRSVFSHLPWATASAVVSQAQCPVLTIRS